MTSPFTTEDIAVTRQLASDAGVEYLPEYRNGYFDAPCAYNSRTGRSVVYYKSKRRGKSVDGHFDLWVSMGEIYAADVSREKALDWLR